jgi:hypothetical protein
MLLESLDSSVVLRDTQLSSFLSQDWNDPQKLGPCQATAFEVLRYIGSGVDGLVLECRSPHGGSVALKLVRKGNVFCEVV